MFASAYHKSRRSSGLKAPNHSDRANDLPEKYNGSSRRLRNGGRDVVKGNSSMRQSNMSARMLVQGALVMLFIGVLMCAITGLSVYMVLKEKLDKHTVHKDVSVPALKASLDKLQSDLENNVVSNKARMDQMENRLQINISLVNKTLTEENVKTIEMLGQTNDKLVHVETEVTMLNKTTNAKLEQLENIFKQNSSMTGAKIDRVEFELQSGINNVNNSLTDTQTSISAQLNATNTNLTAVIQTIETTNQQLVQVETNLSAVNEELANLSAKVLTPPQTILFSARYPPFDSASNDKAFVYETVIMNMGGGYDNTTGIFTAPVAGRYIFSAQICVIRTKSLFASIVAENTFLAPLVITAPSTSATCASTVVFAKIQAGAQIMVNCTLGCDSDDLTGTSVYFGSSFTGILMN